MQSDGIGRECRIDGVQWRERLVVDLDQRSG